MTCEFSHNDGAYVLGSLPAAERSEYRDHLSSCAECTKAVQELAGLPGLLTRVPTEVLESPLADEPVPDTLLPALVRKARRAERRRTWMTSSLVAAAATVIVAASSLTLRGVIDQDTASSTVASRHIQAGQAMMPVVPVPMSAHVVLTSVPWGTRLDLSCAYRSTHGAAELAGWRYALVVRTQDGNVQQVATWRASSDTSMRLTSTTSAPRDSIVSVQIRTMDGKPVLKLAL